MEYCSPKNRTLNSNHNIYQTRVGHGLDSSTHWIGLDWIGSNFLLKNLDWIGSEVLSASLFFRKLKRLRLVFSFVKMHFWFSGQLVIGL